MENLNIALIGCGMIGREHIERIQNRIRNARIVAVCDVFEEGAKKGAEIAGAGTKVYTDFNEAINDPDVNAVVVTTPGQLERLWDCHRRLLQNKWGLSRVTTINLKKEAVDRHERYISRCVLLSKRPIHKLHF